jgi:predicted nucleic acid-binding Zn ribbon protein
MSKCANCGKPIGEAPIFIACEAHQEQEVVCSSVCAEALQKRRSRQYFDERMQFVIAAQQMAERAAQLQPSLYAQAQRF